MVTISYIITTKNKLPYLKDRLEKLFEQKSGDEEILIADGASTDGTKEYLEGLKRAGKIDYLISEPDFGESHALNKLILAAHGMLVKVITDDDIFHYPTINICKEFMLAHPEIDFVGTEGGFKNQDNTIDIRPLISKQDYEKWQKHHTPFNFCGLGHILRKSSLPIIGLWNPSFRRADAEFSFRVTAGKANIAWYTGYSFVNISNPQSVSLVYMKKIKDETDRLNKFYLNKNPDSFLTQKMKALKIKLSTTFGTKQSPEVFKTRWPEIANVAEKWLDIKNKEKKPEFIWNINT
jgi:glycosyltransferase involved in cell wall biosynthesis